MWVMVPAGAPTTDMIKRLTELAEPGDVIVDGGNTNWKLAVQDAALVTERGMHYLDSGTSGGIWWLANGYCLMVGGEQPIFDHCLPLLRDLAPDDGGLVYTGPAGSGHFVKMVHNGIEYGLMAAYAEGLNILAGANVGAEQRSKDAETAPLTHPQYYRYDLDLPAVAEVWRRGSVVASWLLDLTANALFADPELAGFEGHVSDSGEGRWTLTAAIDEGVPVPVLSTALFARFTSRGNALMADKLLSAMRAQFGGHAEVTHPAADALHGAPAAAAQPTITS